MRTIEDLPEQLPVLPLRNECDLDDLPSQIRYKMHFPLVENLVDVCDICLVAKRVRRTA